MLVGQPPRRDGAAQALAPGKPARAALPKEGASARLPRQHAGGGSPPPPLPAGVGPASPLPEPRCRISGFPPAANSPCQQRGAVGGGKKPPSRPRGGCSAAPAAAASPGGGKKGREGGPSSPACRSNSRAARHCPVPSPKGNAEVIPGEFFQLGGCTALAEPTPERREEEEEGNAASGCGMSPPNESRGSPLKQPAAQQRVPGPPPQPVPFPPPAASQLPQPLLLCWRARCQPAVPRWSPLPWDKGGHAAQAGQTTGEPQAGIILLLLCRPCPPTQPQAPARDGPVWVRPCRPPPPSRTTSPAAAAPWAADLTFVPARGDMSSPPAPLPALPPTADLCGGQLAACPPPCHGPCLPASGPSCSYLAPPRSPAPHPAPSVTSRGCTRALDPWQMEEREKRDC